MSRATSTPLSVSVCYTRWAGRACRTLCSLRPNPSRWTLWSRQSCWTLWPRCPLNIPHDQRLTSLALLARAYDGIAPVSRFTQAEI
jgi:hypothetical protein